MSAMTLVDRLGAGLPRGPVTVELDDIQATVLRYRPEPYYGTHVLLHVDDARAGRAFLRGVAPHVDSAAAWWQAGAPWIAVAVTYAGLAALGVPDESLQSFPEAFRVGMAARADAGHEFGTMLVLVVAVLLLASLAAQFVRSERRPPERLRPGSAGTPSRVRAPSRSQLNWPAM